MFVAPGGRKVGSPTRRVRRQLPVWQLKNCTPLWREADLSEHAKTTSLRALLEIERLKNIAKLHAVVA
jgi:hypothetical protein